MDNQQWDNLADYYQRSIAFDEPRPSDSEHVHATKRAAQENAQAMLWLIDQLRDHVAFDDVEAFHSMGRAALRPNGTDVVIYVRAALPEFAIDVEYASTQEPINAQRVSSEEIVGALEQLVAWAMG